MLSWTIQITILSVIFIWLVHHLFNYLRDMLTVPKIKDLVHEPSKKYKTMYEIINKSNAFHAEEYERDHDTKMNTIYNSMSGSTPIQNLEYTREELLPRETLEPKTTDTSDMKNELKNFLRKIGGA